MQVYIITLEFDLGDHYIYSIEGVYADEATAKRIYDKWVNEAGLYETYSLEPWDVL